MGPAYLHMTPFQPINRPVPLVVFGIGDFHDDVRVSIHAS